MEWLKPLTKQEAMEQAQAQGWPLSALNTPADVMRDPHMRERGFFVTVDHPEAGSIELPGLALRFSSTRVSCAARPCWASTTSRSSASSATRRRSRRASHPERDLGIEGATQDE